MFGENASEIIFNFVDFADNNTMELCAVSAIYPENAGMAHVPKEMKRSYRETIPELIDYYRYSAIGDALIERKYADSAQLKI